MRHDEFIGQVQSLAALPDRGTAERAVRATLETLAERIPDGLAEHLAAQLPREIAEHLLRVTTSHEASPEERAKGTRFDLATFAARIAWRGGTSEEVAIRHAGAVLEVLDAALSPELMAKLDHALPHDIRELLPTTRARQSELTT
ncbi:MULTISPECIES: DUF2267 domain-containing protein [Streptomycetaceae]|uniref:DUF2267 domain-containing protein n=1 Tax=Streptantibioticus cattleyicolor (strain ATCC 35852 / DSM 46488 / JCM 4925 / NBRC 14057 / NRRL 8057) TaxID=1003195 RepID=F8K1R2_STREN|nr:MULTISPECIES: DUF2267 domain-containing protein [Streptomycetaceae]AEW92382.1 hypothetical protein SCATT_00110 [Streptantibioticus cattleyicolor NRRL 8057 = DSM 46488]MYS57195.1 DUF2267 domain-containing protein [Streptomyces sp. SID5468]CCB72746.1 conserved protein of unknown function [Streptantibioticus cattleyicolor NRRL 8057 = DSM 46488]